MTDELTTDDQPGPDTDGGVADGAAVATATVTDDAAGDTNDTAVVAAESEDAAPAVAAESDAAGASAGADESGAEESAAEEPAVPARPLPFTHGDVIKGRVVKIDHEHVRFDLGLWVEGVMPIRELVRTPGTFADELVTIGEEVEALVTSTQAPDGQPRLSIVRMQLREAWKPIEDAQAGDGLVDVTVVEAIKGGLRCDLHGVEAFMPASLVDTKPIADLSSFVGQTLKAKIVEADKKRFKVVVSRKPIVESERRAMRDQVFAELHEGEVRTGTISTVTDIGAFVDIGGADGLVHVTEMSWARVGNPKTFVKPGQEVQVKVISLDPGRGRISLSMKQAQENPWDSFTRTHREGEVINGKIVKLMPFGAFVEVAEGVEGLVHISELAPRRVEKAEDVVKPGDEVQVRILAIETSKGRLSLSIRAVEDPDGRPAGGGRGPGGGGGGGGRGGRGGRDRGPRGGSFGEGAANLNVGSRLDKKSAKALDALKLSLSPTDDDADA